MVALDDVAAERGQQVLHRLVLHPLGHDAQTQVVPQVDHRGAGDAGSLPVGGHILHEHPVDLHLVDGQVLQVGERRVAGARYRRSRPTHAVVAASR